MFSQQSALRYMRNEQLSKSYDLFIQLQQFLITFLELISPHIIPSSGLVFFKHEYKPNILTPR
jgi:hypothetical protein